MWLLLVACRSPGLEVVAADDRGPLPTTSAIQGRDGGYSARIGDLSVWAHGDTILSAEGSSGSWLHSSVSWTSDLDASDGIDGFQQDEDDAGLPVPFFPNDEVIWAGALVADPVRGGALVAWLRLPDEGDESAGLAPWQGPGTSPTDPDDGLFPADVRMNSALAEHDGLLYGFGCHSVGFGKPCTVGRADFESALEPSGWAFWDGRGWSDDPGDAKVLFDAHDILSVSFSPFGELWLAVYSEPLGTGVFARTAPELTGPWSSPVELFEALPADDGADPYSAVAHVEYSRPTADGWSELVTYHRGTQPWHSELRQVEVELRVR
jgi:hypothetical protein